LFFLDSDVVIDFFTDRAPFSSSASELFELNEQGVVTLFLSAVSINNIYYIVRKFLGHKKAIEVITLLTEITEVIGTTKKEIVQALKNEFDDFEDSIQFSSALTIENVDAIITRNIKDYRNSTVVVMTPLEFLKMIDENSNKL
jgi:predicted nucleic acid-binding protein